jgi:DNA-directed RNA polymerase subunit RPC12/RpoP
VEFMSAAELFKCPNCNSQYKLVRVEADPAASYRQIECPHCGGPLNNREGKFILKYFLVDHPRRQIRPPRGK